MENSSLRCSFRCTCEASAETRCVIVARDSRRCSGSPNVREAGVASVLVICFGGADPAVPDESVEAPATLDAAATGIVGAMVLKASAG